MCRQISLIDRVDKIYRDTVWAAADRSSDHGHDLGAMGFVIKKIMVHNTHTSVARGQEHYNMDTGSWDVRHLLEVGLTGGSAADDQTGTDGGSRPRHRTDR